MLVDLALPCAHCATNLGMNAGACFSPDRSQRYVLWRTWEPHKPAMVAIMLNPSKGDEQKLDPTLRRIYTFARYWGYGAMWVMNAFSAVSTDPDALKAARLIDPINDAHLRALCGLAGRVIVGWGTHIGRSHLCYRLRELREILADTACLAWIVTRDGHPKHPLYVAGSTTPVPFLV